MAEIQAHESVQACQTEAPASIHSPRGMQWTYWRDSVNHCPGCGRTSWYIGRFSAECCHCRTALALEHSGMLGVGTFRLYRHG